MFRIVVPLAQMGDFVAYYIDGRFMIVALAFFGEDFYFLEKI
jgi:hypothetical protein|tara:strand:+ start:561 stop:686 length:126 start_codon:yes stop_codon:yes gene_type:complete